MEYVIVGLGNPGEEYVYTRHNIGREVVEALQKKLNISSWRDDKKLHALIAEGALENGESVRLVLPQNYMNRSGGSVAPLIKSKKHIERLIVVHDDIDLPVPEIKIVFNRGSGGHRGVESIERALKSKEFIRVRIGVSPTTPKGKIKKPKGEKIVHDFILKKTSKKDREVFTNITQNALEAVEAILYTGLSQAMCVSNGKGGEQKKKIPKKTKVVGSTK